MTGGRGRTGVTAAQAMLLAGRGRLRRRVKAKIRALRDVLASLQTQAETARQLGISARKVYDAHAAGML